MMTPSKELLKNSILNILNDVDLEIFLPEILAAFQFLELKKQAFFVEEGTTCRYFCFVQSGILMHAIEVSGEEKTTYLALKNTYTSALKSFKNQIPARKSIKALSHCQLWVLTAEDFHRLLKDNTAFGKFYFNLIENQIFLIDDYRIDLLTLSPEERYQKMLHNEPKLLQEVPLRYLASFLGISTRSMSRIRKNCI
ncbi:MAG: Crp/Fnr family transcriptional regulator [Flavobacteriaceae bacterium]